MAQPLEVLHLPVRTKSGRQLGVVTDVVIDPDTQGVVRYVVRAHRLIPTAITKSLEISRSQIIGFDAEGMIVDDASVSAAVFAAPTPSAA